MAINYTVEDNFEKLKAAFERDFFKTQSAIEMAVKRFALLIQTKAATKIQKGSRSGRAYTRGGKIRRASAAGEPPKTDTGILVSSIRPTFQSPFMAEVGSLSNVAKYGGHLEDKMDRPWLKPTLDENQSILNKYIGQALKKGGLID